MSMVFSTVRGPKGIHLLRVTRLLNIDVTDLPAGSCNMIGAVREYRLKIRNGAKPEPIIDVAVLLNVLRTQLGYSAKQMAEEFGVPTTTYQNWERGIMPSTTHTMRVAERLNLPVSAISYL